MRNPHIVVQRLNRRRSDLVRGVASVAVCAVIMSACSASERELPATRRPVDVATAAETSVPEVTDTDAVGTDGDQRFRFDGITLVYPSSLFSRLIGRLPLTGGSDVEISFRSGSDELARLDVVSVRTLAGESAPGLSEVDRAAVEAVEAITTDGDVESPDVIEFVNGIGRRHVDDDTYTFDGVSRNGRFLVRFEVFDAAVRADDMDAMLASVYIDSTAAVFRPNVCDDAVEIANIDGVPLGTRVGPGETVTATWEVTNVGTCTWSDAYSWVFGGGGDVTVVSTSGLDGIEPGSVASVEAVFVAPDELGPTTVRWNLQSPRQFAPLEPAARTAFEVTA